MTQPLDVPSTAYTFAERILIVPAAHTRVLDVAFQLEMYELFHRTAGGRWGHLVGTPVILFGVLMGLGALPGLLGVPVAAALLLAIVGLAVFVDRLVGVVTALAGLTLATLAFLATYVAGAAAVPIGLALFFGGCAVQTFSHLFEDVPPPQSGTTRFIPMAQWIRAIGVREVVRSTVLTLAVFYWLELWATPRIWPLQILHLMMRAGYRPELRRQLDARTEAIVAAPESAWRRGA